MNYSNAQQDATHRRADYPLGSSQLPPRDAQNGPPNSAFTNQSLPLNQPNLSIQGDQTVRIEALLDYDGIVDLEHKIAALKMLIKRKTKAAEPVAQDSSPDLDDVLS